MLYHQHHYYFTPAESSCIRFVLILLGAMLGTALLAGASGKPPPVESSVQQTAKVRQHLPAPTTQSPVLQKIADHRF